MNLSGLAMDWIERVAGRPNPVQEPAGLAGPRLSVSEAVSVSHATPFYIYHVPYGELGLGASFGNSSTWVETKGTGEMLSLFNIQIGKRVFGGMSLVYLLPFTDLSLVCKNDSEEPNQFANDGLSRALPSSEGEIHLHPAFQQRSLVIGDGLEVLETFFVPRYTDCDCCAACVTVSMNNRTARPIKITVVADVALRGETERDIEAKFDHHHNCLVAANKSHPSWVRAFGTNARSTRYLASTDEEGTYSPRLPLPNRIDGSGDLLGALEEDLLLLPGENKQISITLAFSEKGEDQCLKTFEKCLDQPQTLQETIECFERIVSRAALNCPDHAISEGLAWSKVCLLRPLAKYKDGLAATNDPGQSSNIVGRDSAWMVLGADYVVPNASCSTLRTLAVGQREDGLIPEYVNGITGEAEYLDFNINDATPLFLMAVAHHLRIAAHRECLDGLLGPATKAGELILSQMDGRGLVVCKANGVGPRGICGWRNVLRNEQISGAVTEVNAECHAGLLGLAEICELAGKDGEAKRYREAASALRKTINAHLIDPRSGLYVRNIGLDENVFTQASVDMVYPLLCGVAEEETHRLVCARLSEPDFLAPVGLRVLPQTSPNYDPSRESGCLGGVWTGATWWYAMALAKINPDRVARLLSSSYRHYLEDPRTSNTVPGQFSEWSDGETFVNRGMRLSPWDAPRFLTACLESLAGIEVNAGEIVVRPAMPMDWKWLQIENVVVRGQSLSYFLVRSGKAMLMFTSNDVRLEAPFGTVHQYEERLESPETLTTGVATAAFRKSSDVVIIVANSLATSVGGPLLAHHVLNSSTTYRVVALLSPDEEWSKSRIVRGKDVQRMNVRLEPGGYAVFRFSAE